MIFQGMEQSKRGYEPSCSKNCHQEEPADPTELNCRFAAVRSHPLNGWFSDFRTIREEERLSCGWCGTSHYLTRTTPHPSLLHRLPERKSQSACFDKTHHWPWRHMLRHLRKKWQIMPLDHKPHQTVMRCGCIAFRQFHLAVLSAKYGNFAYWRRHQDGPHPKKRVSVEIGVLIQTILCPYSEVPVWRQVSCLELVHHLNVLRC